MIDSCMFEKKDIIEWENWQNKTFRDAKSFFEQLVDNDDIYTNVVGGTAKRTRFESAIHTREEQQPEKHNDEAISSNERIQVIPRQLSRSCIVKRGAHSRDKMRRKLEGRSTG